MLGRHAGIPVCYYTEYLVLSAGVTWHDDQIVRVVLVGPPVHQPGRRALPSYAVPMLI